MVKVFDNFHSMRIKVTFAPKRYLSLSMGYNGSGVSGNVFSSQEQARAIAKEFDAARNRSSLSTNGDFVKHIASLLEKANNAEQVLTILKNFQ